jgi:hypothetical protein
MIINAKSAIDTIPAKICHDSDNALWLSSWQNMQYTDTGNVKNSIDEKRFLFEQVE